MVGKNSGVGTKMADTKAPFARTEAQAQAALDEILRKKAEDEKNNATWKDVDTPRALELKEASAIKKIPQNRRD